jgi:AcrR family transcriptional regulator
MGSHDMSTRKANKERTRHKLVQATLKILHKQGPTALTTGRIAQAAGVAQPTFYVHFKDMDEALEEAAITVGDALRARLREFRDGLQDGASPQAATRHAFATGVEALTADRRSAELFLRHRRDVANPLGRRWRELMDGAREDLRIGAPPAGSRGQQTRWLMGIKSPASRRRTTWLPAGFALLRVLRHCVRPPLVEHTLLSIT